MLGLAQYITRSQTHAVLCIAIISLIASDWVPPVGVLSGAAIVLVALQKPWIYAFNVFAFALLLSCGLLMVMGYMERGLMIVVFLLPLLLAAATLRQSGNLALAILVLAISVLLCLSLVFALDTHIEAKWQSKMHENLQKTPDLMATLTAEQISHLARLMLVVAIWFTTNVMVFSLLLGRWWQSKLDGVNNFWDECSQLRLGRILTLLAVPIIVATQYTDSMTVIIAALAMLVMYLYNGLAAIYVLLGNRPGAKFWFGVIFVLSMFILQISLLVSFFGMLDAWVDSRRRWLPKRP